MNTKILLQDNLEQEFFSKGYDYVIGVDEVGRGPLAGPVVAAAVLFEQDFFGKYIERERAKVDLTHARDSKKLSAKKRQVLSLMIQEQSLTWSLQSISEAMIDEHNILKASLRAMRFAVEECLKKVSENSNVLVLVDGNQMIPGIFVDQESIVGGDDKVFSIAAASIIAKVYRDDYMVDLAHRYPQYGFEQHKGYGTKAHIEAISNHGISEVHRKTFCKKFIKLYGEP